MDHEAGVACTSLTGAPARLCSIHGTRQGAELPAAQTLGLTSSGASRLDRVGGYTPAAIRVSADPAGLAPGEYSASINVVSTDARNSPRAVRVTLRVFAGMMVRNGASLAPGPLAPGSLCGWAALHLH